MQFRVEKTGIVHAAVGKASFGPELLADNIRAFVDAVNKAKPSGAKGTYLKRAAISATMGPGIKVDVPTLVGLRPSACAARGPAGSAPAGGERLRAPAPHDGATRCKFRKKELEL